MFFHVRHNGILCISCFTNQFYPWTVAIFRFGIFDHSPHCFQPEMVWKSNKSIHSNSNLFLSVRLNENSLWIKSHPKHLQRHRDHIRLWFLTLRRKKIEILMPPQMHEKAALLILFRVKNINAQDHIVTVTSLWTFGTCKFNSAQLGIVGIEAELQSSAISHSWHGHDKHTKNRLRDHVNHALYRFFIQYSEIGRDWIKIGPHISQCRMSTCFVAHCSSFAAF